MAKKIKEGAKIVTLNDLLFPVELIDNPNRTNSEYSKIVVGTLNDGGDPQICLNYCSPRYELVPNADIFPKIEETLNNAGIEYISNYSHIDHARFYVNYRITDKRYGYKMKGSNGDTIEPVLRVQHSYNGLTKYKIHFGYFRLICSNGLTIPVQEMKEFNLSIIGKHTTSIIQSIDKLKAMLEYFQLNALQVTLAITAKYEELGGRMVNNVEDRIKEVLAATGIAAIENKNFNTLNYIVERIDSEKYLYNGNVNDFLIYNGINHYINNESLNIAAPEKRMENDSLVLEFMLKN